MSISSRVISLEFKRHIHLHLSSVLIFLVLILSNTIQYQNQGKVPLAFFDSVLMFMVPDLGKQINSSGLIREVAKHLKKGAFFIGSGRMFPINTGDHYYNPLVLQSSIRLEDHNDGFPFRQNTGIILKKTVNIFVDSCNGNNLSKS